MLGLGLGLPRMALRAGATGGGFDPDAAAFITAVEAAGGTLSATEKEAINTRVLDWKGIGPNNGTVDLWTSNIHEDYPVVGGVGAAHAIGLRTLLSGTFNGGWTHSVNGAYSNGTTGYFDTGHPGNDYPDPSLGGIGCYIGATLSTNTDGYAVAVNGTLSTAHAISNSNIGNNALFDWKGGINGVIAGDVNGIGVYGTARISATHILCFKNESGGAQAAAERVGVVSDNIWFGGVNNFGVLGLPKANQFRSMMIYYDVDATELELIQAIDNAFQTSIGRNVY